MWRKGATNGLADIGHLQIGNAHDSKARTGTTVLVFDQPATASVSILGQAPGTRDIALLDTSRTVDRIDGLVLSGGSAFGLSAAEIVMQRLADAGRGFAVGDVRVPIVPAAILFDLNNGGDKPKDLTSLYRSLGKQALANLSEGTALGAVGAGTGAATGGGPGGLGTASCTFDDGAPEPLQGKSIAALVAVNAVGSPYIGEGPHLRAAPFELEGEFGGLGAAHAPEPMPRMKTIAEPGQNTTIGCVVTNIALDKRGCHNLAIAGQDGIATAVYPAHTTLDGDLVIGASVSDDMPLSDPALIALAQAATTATMARAVARGVHAAAPQIPSQA